MRFRICFSFAVLILISGCSFLYPDVSDSGESGVVIDLSQVEEPWRVSDFSAVNQNGEPITNMDFEGEWWLVKTIFTRCPTVCMTMTPNMVTLQNAISEEELPVKIVSFSIDPEFDTPERLLDYGEGYSADLDSWDFLTGYEFEFIQSWALESLKAQVQELPDEDDRLHPTRFFLVNPEGVIVRMYNGDGSFDLEPTITDLTNLINE